MSYSRLKSMTKKELIEFLIPVIELAVKVNECFQSGDDEMHPVDKDFDGYVNGVKVSAHLTSLHNDYDFNQPHLAV